MRGEPIVIPDDYQIGNCSVRVVDFIVSTVRRHKQWSGLR
jgi:UDP-N-acetylglucosamine 2-epimerase (non-hydrolysing)